MKQEDLFKKYKNEIDELTNLNNKIAEDFEKSKLDFEKFIEYMIEIKGEIHHLNQSDFNNRMIELHGIVKDSYKNLLALYGIAFANMQRINRMDLFIRILFEKLMEYGDFSDLKNKIRRLEKDTKFLSDDEMKWVLHNLKERMKELENMDKNGEKID